mmetsp:Transcript_12980/g.23395  ORF Transcript_12980/g.23395 Transcript_12980/m.23395 type:complete len:434 (+) Transcript_12980:108-1409(+)
MSGFAAASDNGLANLIGDELIAADGSKVATGSIDKKCVMLYFSAKWCGPCRNFTKTFLIDFYNKLKDKIEIVFVSGDRDEAGFDEYRAEMPWLALPYADRERQAMLMKKLKVRGIPTLAFSDLQGNIYETSGRNIVMKDPEGSNFPWVPPTLTEALGTKFVKNGEEITMDSLKGKNIALYFSAHWCPPCRGFTPELIKTYKKVTQDGKPWEVIFVSWDKTEEEFKEYFEEMPWAAIPFSEEKRKEQLGNQFEIEGIPALIMLDSDLNVINKGARSYVSNDPEGKSFPWVPKPVLKLVEGINDINDQPALLVLAEKESSGTITQFESILEILAKEHKASGAEPIGFLISTDAEFPVAQRIRDLCKLKNEEGTRTLCNGDMCMKLDASTAVVMLDIPDNGGFYKMSGELTSENIKKFVTGFLSGSLKPQRMQMEG